MTRRVVVLRTEADRTDQCKPCASCGQLFYRRKVDTHAYFARAKYCSRECYGTAWRIMSAARRPSLETMFNANVSKTATCWEWTGARDRDGYGMLTREHITYKAHRLSLQLAGVEVPRGSMVCHHCDNPWCVNPSHLYVGTSKDNSRDAVARGRVRRGERQHMAKLTDAAVREIRAGVISDKDAAEKFGVSRSAISLARLRQTWRHLP